MKIEWIPNSTPFPNHLVDTVMPRLRDTEWRLLCVIVRQTLGWVDPITGKRKRTDWLTHYQLKRRTGRESAAISQALDMLVRSSLIEVRDLSGKVLGSPALRRRHNGRIGFSLSPHLVPAREAPDPV